MDRIKNIYISALALLAFGVAACTEVEPIEMQVNGAEKDYSAVKAFKSSEHPVSLVWMDTWSADGNMSSYLSALPDSRLLSRPTLTW